MSSLGDQAILSQNFVSLIFGNCIFLSHVLCVFNHVRSQFQEKNLVFPVKKFLSLVQPRNVIMFQELIICQVGR